MNNEIKSKDFAFRPVAETRPLTLREVLRLRDGLERKRDLHPARHGRLRLPAPLAPLFSLN